MINAIDDRNGLIKVFWQDIRERAAKIEPAFAKIVDELNPDKSFPLYLAYYPYGAIKGDTHSTLFPCKNGNYYRVTDSNAPLDIVQHLGYSKNSAPFALLMEKNVELFVDLKNERITIPRLLYSPGSFFPFSRILSQKNNRTYAPNGVLTMTSGARSIFMLPNIGCATNHSNLQRDFNVQSPAAKTLYDQWIIFREIIHSDSTKSNWKSCLLYFSQNWLDKLHSDSAWIKLKLYLHELAWQHYEFQRSHFYYDLSFSIIQKKRNLKPNPYLADTARHFITIALGAAPGYSPAINDDALPKETLEHAFVESYGLKKYLTAIIQPSHYHFENEKYPIYYSLQHPSTQMFSPKSSIAVSTLSEMRELERITRIFTEELSSDEGTCSNTIISSISKNIEFNFYHNKIDQHKLIKLSSEIFNQDDRFHHRYASHSNADAKFSCDAPFLRGCISIKNKLNHIF